MRRLIGRGPAARPPRPWAHAVEPHAGPLRAQYAAGVEILKQAYREHCSACDAASRHERRAELLTAASTALAAFTSVTIPTSLAPWISWCTATLATFASGYATLANPAARARAERDRAVLARQLGDDVSRTLRKINDSPEPDGVREKIEEELARHEDRRNQLLGAGG